MKVDNSNSRLIWIELQDGVEVELDDPSVLVGSNRLPHVTIIACNKDWNYLCRFHDEERPRQRNVRVSATLF